MAVDLQIIGHVPKRKRRYSDPTTPGRVSRLRFGYFYADVPNETVDRLDNWDDGRPGNCYRVVELPEIGLIPKWNDITPGSLIDGASKFGIGEHLDPFTMSFDATWANSSEGIFLKLGNSATGGITLGRSTSQGPNRLILAYGPNNAGAQAITYNSGGFTAAHVVLAFNPFGGVDPEYKIKVWVDGLETLESFHQTDRWQNDFTDDGGYARTETDHITTSDANAIAGNALSNSTFLSNLTYFPNQLPDAF